MGILKIKGLSYTGAGVLIVEDYYTKNGTVEQCIVVARNTSSGLYSDFGGGYSAKDKTLEQTAHKELREESRNLYNIDPKHMKYYVDIPGQSNNGPPASFYRAFLVKINGTSRKYFNYNKNLIDTLHLRGTTVPHSWRETDDIAHIPIKYIDFNSTGFRGKIILKDIDGRDIVLHGRVKKILNYAQSIMSVLINSNPIARRKNITIHQSRRWTNKTYSFYAN